MAVYQVTGEDGTERDISTWEALKLTGILTVGTLLLAFFLGCFLSTPRWVADYATDKLAEEIVPGWNGDNK